MTGLEEDHYEIKVFTGKLSINNISIMHRVFNNKSDDNIFHNHTFTLNIYYKYIKDDSIYNTDTDKRINKIDEDKIKKLIYNRYDNAIVIAQDVDNPHHITEDKRVISALDKLKKYDAIKILRLDSAELYSILYDMLSTLRDYKIFDVHWDDYTGKYLINKLELIENNTDNSICITMHDRIKVYKKDIMDDDNDEEDEYYL